jgi:ribosome-binding protein aMBF1 (putative translation factor)
MANKWVCDYCGKEIEGKHVKVYCGWGCYDRFCDDLCRQEYGEEGEVEYDDMEDGDE